MSFSYGQSCDYDYIAEGLKSLWPELEKLAHEIANFVPKSRTEFQYVWDAEMARLREIRPQSPIDELENELEQRMDFQYSPQWQFIHRFDGRAKALSVNVTIVAHALCEAAINAILAIGLLEAKIPELFTILEDARVVEKWQIGIKSFWPSYALRRGCALEESLVKLNRERNGLVHHKIELVQDGATLMKGSSVLRQPFQDQLVWIARFFSLPFDLVEHARRQCGNRFAFLLNDRTPILLAEAHRSCFD
jgi:hypothetical protein